MIPCFDEDRDPPFRKIAKRTDHIYKHQEIAPILDYLSRALGVQLANAMKIQEFQRASCGIGTKGELSLAMQTGFPSVTGINLLESLMLTEKLWLWIISKQITLNPESEACDKHWLHST
jgi:hypothetical protein